MKTFRLLNIATWTAEVFEIGQAPPYLAISHACDAIQQTIRRRGLHQVRYCWIDLFCIIQDSDEDICEQIPLMSIIYGDAAAVLIILTNRLELTQEQVDHGTAQLDEALAVWHAEAWAEDGVRQYWDRGRGRGKLVQAMDTLARFTNAAWGTRVWTLQEYLLAKELVWIGADLTPLSIRDELFVAVPRLCEELSITECARRGDPTTRKYELLFSHFAGMAARRTGAIDRTRVMEMLGNRQASVPVDEVYGTMAVSTVEISIRPEESRESAWKRWTEAALATGHLRWLMVPPAMTITATDDAIGLTCEAVPCSKRHMLSSASGLDTVTPYGSVAVSEGTVSLTVRPIGPCTILRRLSPVHRGSNGWVHRDLTLILYAQGVWLSAIDVAVAFGAGRYSNKQLLMIAQILTNNYDRALRSITTHLEPNFHPAIQSERYAAVWADFMQLQSQCVMDTLNFGVGYLVRIQCHATQMPFMTVLVTNGRCPEGDLVAFDCNAQSGDGRHTLLIGEKPVMETQTAQAGGADLTWHKAGVTISVGDVYACGWDRIPLVEINVGGSRCQVCQRASAAADMNMQSSVQTPRSRKDVSRTTRERLQRRRRDEAREKRINRVIKSRLKRLVGCSESSF